MMKAQPRSLRTIRILGKQVVVKGYLCSEDGITYLPKPEQVKLQFSIIPTDLCPAACPFCIASADRDKNRWVDLRKLEQVLIRLEEEQVVRGISITGGEPFLDVTLLDEIIRLIYEVMGYHTEISLNTNGMHLDQMHRIRDLSYLDALHISRHHYDDTVNESLFAVKVPGKEELKEILSSVSYPDLFVLNCMLMKDYIRNREEVHRFLDFAIETGAPKVSFITPSPVNSFVRNQMVEYRDVISQDDPAILFTRCFQDYDICRCQDGVYVSDEGKLVQFYGRCTNTDSLTYCRGLVYGADNHLRTGFGGEVIL